MNFMSNNTFLAANICKKLSENRSAASPKLKCKNTLIFINMQIRGNAPISYVNI